MSDATSVEDIDISVHCDIKIFEWLMRYVRMKEMQEKGEKVPESFNVPKLDLKNVISILISSDFL